MTRIIAMMPVRNEAWILERTLRTLSTFCDVILVADQRSTDGTSELLRRYAPKVVVIDNPSNIHSTQVRWRLLDAAREYAGENFLIFTDADEILSANILDDKILANLVSLQPGTSILLELVNLWRNPKMWRNDNSVWTGRYMEIGFRDDRCVKYGPVTKANDHNLRIPFCKQIERIDTIKLLHFQFVLFERMLCKQRYYRTAEAVTLSSNQGEEINHYYCLTRDERNLHLDPILAEWTTGWTEIGIDLEHFEESSLYWYDVEVLRWFAQKGVACFASIDIWDVDWEGKRRLAKERGYSGIPDEPIVDPRTREEKLYHAYLHRFFHTPPWRDPRHLSRILYHSFCITLRSTGLRRRHLERLGFSKSVDTA